ncbi:Cgr1 family-domain-containing protein [Mycena rebaudengoi]|nr:Cgr1 family-domain-containing protein [Mycena rebaudengoi]
MSHNRQIAYIILRHSQNISWTQSRSPLNPSANGRVSGKSWKPIKTPIVRSHLQDGVKTKSWEERMQKTQKALAIKKLQAELKDEKQADFARNNTGPQKAAEDRRRLEEDKAKMGARKAARLRRKAGRSKKING